MKKKLIISTIIAMAITGSVYASEPVNAVSQDEVNKALIAIKEKETTPTVENYGNQTVFDSNDIPTLDSMSNKIDKSAEAKSQVDTAKSISDKINQSLETTSLQGQVAAENVDKIINVDDCVKIALAHHPSIVSSKSSAEIYKTKIGQAWANYFPKFSVGAEYSRNDMMVTMISPSQQRYNMFYLPTASANLMLFDFGKTKSEADIAKKTYQAAEDNVQKSINDVIFNVKKTYYNLLYAIQQEKVLETSVHDYQIHLEQAKAFYRIGTKAKIDVLTAEYNLGKSKLDLIKAKNSVKLAYASVNNAIGVPEFSGYEIDENLATRSYDVILDDMLKTAFETRPEYLAAKKKAEGSKLLVRASKRAFLPDLKAFGSVQYGGVHPGNDVGYQFGANLSYSNFNGLLLKKQVDEAKATAKKDIADLENTRQSVYLEVKQAYIDLQNAKDSIPVSSLAMMQAKEQYDLASGRYKVGLGDAVELKDAENTYRQAQLEYYSTLMNYNIAAANLERVTGAPIVQPNANAQTDGQTEDKSQNGETQEI